MEAVLQDNTKFRKIDPVDSHEPTDKTEYMIPWRLLDLVKCNLLPKSQYERVRPAVAQQPRIYGLPKIHKDEVPLRQILSIIDSVQYKLSTWLAEILEPVLYFIRLTAFLTLFVSLNPFRY